MNQNKGKNGKKFEDDFMNSCPNHILIKRLNDNASGWADGTKTRFASKNECDFICHDANTGIFYGLELKSTEGSSFTFWREDFEEEIKKKNKNPTYMIKKNQILGLKKWADTHPGVYGFIFHFIKKDGITYYVSIQNFLKYTKNLNKKSLALKDIKNMAPILIKNKKKRTRYKYDLDSFFLKFN